jgi:cobalt-zinc-cadmium efflux system membrane fusion protein
MKKAKYIVLMAIVSVLGFSQCSPAVSEDSHDESGHMHGEEEEESNSDYIVHLKPEQLKVMDIQIGEFKMMNLKTTVKTNGQLELPPQNKASLSAVIAGRVKNVMVIEGQEVRKGQVLAIMENPEAIDLQQEYLSLKSELAFAETDFQRKEELYNDSIGSAKDYQRVKSQFESLNAELSGVKAKLKLLNYSASQLDKGTISSTFNVISPIEGHVRLVEINIGKFVQPEQEMFEIVDNDHIHMDLMVYEKDIDKIREEQKVVFSISTHPEHVFYGRVFSVGKAFESDLKAVRVHAEITSKPTGLLPGMFVEARIVTDSNEVQAVPISAIIEEEGLSYIFVVNESESDDMHMAFSKIEINKGAIDMGFVEVVTAQPIPTNPKVVINGAYYIFAEMNKGEGGGHSH